MTLPSIIGFKPQQLRIQPHLQADLLGLQTTADQ